MSFEITSQQARREVYLTNDRVSVIISHGVDICLSDAKRIGQLQFLAGK